ncbi:MAG: ABC transporter permease [Bacteroidales bacterium]|nr:ABC transporter permease [Bacteroidales bacterium]
MNTELFIARKIFFDHKGSKTLTRPIIKIAVAGVALSIIVMIAALAVVNGFKSEIREKVFDFESNIKLVKYDPNRSFESSPIDHPLKYIDTIKSLEGVKSVQTFATKAGVMKTKDQIQGAVLKGINTDFNESSFNKYLIRGVLPKIDSVKRTNDVVISNRLAKMLHLDVDSSFYMYFIQKPPRMRKFKVCGIYETFMAEYDKRYIIGDIKHIQRLNGWGKDKVGGYEITIKDFDNLEMMTMKVEDIVVLNFDYKDEPIRTESIVENKSGLFDWLELQDMNVVFILTIMIIVACFNMISGMLIVILERTNMIGILKAIGAKTFAIRKIFIYHSLFILYRGLLFGNIIGLGLCLIQKYFKPLTLNAENYFIDRVPVKIDVTHILLLNVGTIAITFIVLIVPSIIIARITPEKSIKFE